MARSKGCIPLSKADIDVLCEELKLKDISYAQNLDITQFNFLKTNPRIKNWKDFKDVEEMKRVMIGLHSGKIEVTHDIDFSERLQKALERAKHGKKK